MPALYSGVYAHSRKEEQGHGKERSYKTRAGPWRKTTKPAARCIWASRVPTGLHSPTLLVLQLALHAASFLGSSAPCLASLTLGLPASPSQLHAVTPRGVGGGSFRGITQFCHILPDFRDFLEHQYKLP